jgi:16S rRNA processing protein RimM
MRAGPRSSAAPASGRRDDEVELGFVSGVFGVTGEVRLHLFNRDDSMLFDGPRQVFLVHPRDGRRVQKTLTVRPGAGRRVLGRLDGVSDREAAVRWQDWRIVVAATDLPALEEGEFYWWQVEGLPVEVGGERAGEVVRVHATAADEVFEVRVDGEKETTFVPAVAAFVERLDLEEGKLVLRPGALERS